MTSINSLKSDQSKLVYLAIIFRKISFSELYQSGYRKFLFILFIPSLFSKCNSSHFSRENLFNNGITSKTNNIISIRFCSVTEF